MISVLRVSQLFLWFGIILIIFVLSFIGYVYFSREMKIQSLPEEYQALARECKEKQNFDCCVNSVRTMAENYYSLMPRQGCPNGFNRGRLSCSDGYYWCEPVGK